MNVFIILASLTPDLAICFTRAAATTMMTTGDNCIQVTRHDTSRLCIFYVLYYFIQFVRSQVTGHFFYENFERVTGICGEFRILKTCHKIGGKPPKKSKFLLRRACGDQHSGVHMKCHFSKEIGVDCFPHHPPPHAWLVNPTISHFSLCKMLRQCWSCFWKCLRACKCTCFVNVLGHFMKKKKVTATPDHLRNLKFESFGHRSQPVRIDRNSTVSMGVNIYGYENGSRRGTRDARRAHVCVITR